MPPKKADKKDAKKDKKPTEKASNQQSEYEAMDLELIRETVSVLRQQLEKVQLDRNYVQLERDAVQTYYDITRKETQDIESELLLKDQEMEHLEENQKLEIKVYIQKVKHLEYEHKNSIIQVKDQGQKGITEEGDLHNGRDRELKTQKKSLKEEIRERQKAYEEEIRLVKELHEKNAIKLREEFSRSAEALRQKCDRRLAQLREDLDLRRKVDVHEIEERKNLHINDLMRNHEKAFKQIKAYYNDITHDNMKLIKALKAEIGEMKKKAAENTKLMFNISQENKRLSEPLAEALKQVESLKHELKDEVKDRMSLRNAKARLVVMQDQLVELKTTQENLERDFAKVEKERNELYDSFESAVRAIQQQSDFKNLVLERKLDEVTADFENREAQIKEILSAANLDPAEMSRVSSDVRSIIESKNGIIEAMEYDLIKAEKTYNDTFDTLRKKLVDFGVPAQEIEQLGYRPIAVKTGTGPANLVVT